MAQQKNNEIILNDVSKKGIGLFPEEQELMSDLGLYFDMEIEEHFEYFNFNEETEKKVKDELEQMKKWLTDPILIDSVEQFWFAHKAGTELERSLVVYLFKKLPKDFPVGEIYVAFTEGYVSFQIVFMPTDCLPYLTSLMLIQNKTYANKDYIPPLIERFGLESIYQELNEQIL